MRSQGDEPMAIDRTHELKPILDVLICLDVSGPDQHLIMDAIESNIETWEQMRLQQRSLALQMALHLLKSSTHRQSQSSIKTYFESCFLVM